jgi:hypothetical protein
MSLPPYLTDEEIEYITRPRTQGAARIKFFRRINVKVEARPNGQPLVWRVDYDAARLAGEAANDSAGNAVPDWTTFDNKVRYGSGTKAKRRQPAGA